MDIFLEVSDYILVIHEISLQWGLRVRKSSIFDTFRERYLSFLGFSFSNIHESQDRMGSGRPFLTRLYHFHPLHT